MTCPSLPEDALSPHCRELQCSQPLIRGSGALSYLMGLNMALPKSWNLSTSFRCTPLGFTTGGKRDVSCLCATDLHLQAPCMSPKVHLLGPPGDLFLPSLAHRCLGIPIPSSVGFIPEWSMGLEARGGPGATLPIWVKQRWHRVLGGMHSLWLQSQAPSRAFSSWL